MCPRNKGAVGETPFTPSPRDEVRDPVNRTRHRTQVPLLWDFHPRVVYTRTSRCSPGVSTRVGLGCLGTRAMECTLSVRYLPQPYSQISNPPTRPSRSTEYSPGNTLPPSFECLSRYLVVVESVSSPACRQDPRLIDVSSLLHVSSTRRRRSPWSGRLRDRNRVTLSKA